MGFRMKVVRKKHATLPDKITGPSKVKVGFPAGTASRGNIMKAVYNEFGTRGGRSGGGWGGPIPERPFMRNTVKDKASVWAAALRADAPLILRGAITMQVTLRKLGMVAAGHIQQEIVSLKSPPNAPVTIMLKGSSNPLIDTGAMHQAVTWKLHA